MDPPQPAVSEKNSIGKRIRKKRADFDDYDMDKSFYRSPGNYVMNRRDSKGQFIKMSDSEKSKKTPVK